MTTLALEFSSDRRSVALACDGIVLAEAVEQTAGRGTNAFALIEKVLVDANVSRDKIEAIVVGLGPGSYTGIRAGIAIAQGWHLATGVKLLGVSSMAALAVQAQADKIFGRVNVVIDAQRGEFYLATWELGENCRTQTVSLKIVAGATVEAMRMAGEICVGPQEANRILFPSAAMMAQLAVDGAYRIPGETLEPIYLRETAFVKAAPSRTL